MIASLEAFVNLEAVPEAVTPNIARLANLVVRFGAPGGEGGWE